MAKVCYFTGRKTVSGKQPLSRDETKQNALLNQIFKKLLF